MTGRVANLDNEAKQSLEERRQAALVAASDAGARAYYKVAGFSRPLMIIGAAAATAFVAHQRLHHQDYLFGSVAAFASLFILSMITSTTRWGFVSRLRDEAKGLRKTAYKLLGKYRARIGEAGAREVEEKIAALSQTGAGNFAMIDYINFKGDGLNPSERYQGEGWGLLQVLLAMKNTRDPREAPGAFAVAAKRVLTRRVEVSPPARHESKWLEGWKNRCDAYRQ